MNGARLGILETPVFQQLLDTNKIEKAPITEVIKKQPKEIILSALLRLSEQAPFYIFTAFIAHGVKITALMPARRFPPPWSVEGWRPALS